MTTSTIVVGDCRTALREMPAGSVHTCITSPPYWGLRDYGHPDQMGLEETPDAFVDGLVGVFREVRRVLRDDGTLWLNMGDTFANSGGVRNEQGLNGGKKRTELDRQRPQRKRVPDNVKPKDLIGLPWLLAFALRRDGWYLRADIIWHKPNAMPDSVRDRPTRAHEFLFLLSKSEVYAYDHRAIREPAKRGHRGSRFDEGKTAIHAQGRSQKGERVDDGHRNKRDVWTVPTEPFLGAHFAAFPQRLVEPCILAGSPPGGTVLDPFCGSGTVGVVCGKRGRHFRGVELNPAYARIASERIAAETKQGALF